MGLPVMQMVSAERVEVNLQIPIPLTTPRTMAKKVKKIRPKMREFKHVEES